ncbi:MULTISPECIES: RNA polymerase factor sigma-54 [Alphaproteobacteria]|uniref:RNA polymerase sigma-54 factor n=2 Tax=Alphaproteobacteria TaxID=28211 RepID=A0A512HDX4_9HYPH|nr:MULTISPECIES: RNA polymerase factor sigma-54 [Alphaproteobacteria]GEO83654.1 RNA polymerase sigma-54 factor [Ciceribacter naphthalenivorans]GLR24194.1 RNA polymerase sigma-54 factor [Ciceribacter naphthalenivorans]GLT07050.1 RNA polymerase sigma-54 factor [Sphingomonas psychrolutea]
MALSANLFLRQNQSLVMTPQLMQSIQLLQMTHLELISFISQEVEKNPLLEMASDDSEPMAEPRAGGSEETFAGAQTEGNTADEGEHPSASLDSEWYEPGHGDGLNERLDTNFDTALSDEGTASRADAPELLGQWKSMPGGGAETGEGYDLDDFVAGQVSIRDHLDQQIPFAFSKPSDRLIAAVLTDHLDEAGYLRADLAEIAERLGETAERVLSVLETLQALDPPGIFARSLSECLSIQLRQRDRLDPAMQSLVDNLELLAKRDFNMLKKLCGVDEEDLVDMLAEIRKLNPKPGSGYENTILESIIPDVVVRPAPDGGWRLELNPDALPRVLVNQDYVTAVGKGSKASDKDQAFLSECLQNANWLTRSLDQRARTIVKVASEIVRQQDAFLKHGVDHLRPLNLKTVADAIKMHESTVSRVTSNKYMLTPRGLFELKYFFSVSIGSAEGGDNHSAEAVRHRIRMMIAQESPDAVLSDDDIVHTLKSTGVDLARRTVAKYREAMNIPSSVQRRREKRARAKIPAI